MRRNHEIYNWHSDVKLLHFYFIVCLYRCLCAFIKERQMHHWKLFFEIIGRVLRVFRKPREVFSQIPI